MNGLWKRTYFLLDAKLEKGETAGRVIRNLRVESMAVRQRVVVCHNVSNLQTVCEFVTYLWPWLIHIPPEVEFDLTDEIILPRVRKQPGRDTMCQRILLRNSHRLSRQHRHGEVSSTNINLNAIHQFKPPFTNLSLNSTRYLDIILWQETTAHFEKSIETSEYSNLL